LFCEEIRLSRIFLLAGFYNGKNKNLAEMSKDKPTGFGSFGEE